MSTRAVVLALSGLLMASGCGGAGVETSSRNAGGTPSEQGRSNRLRAASVAERMLGQVTLPAGARRIATPRSGGLYLTVRAVQAFRIASQVERSAVWKSS